MGRGGVNNATVDGKTLWNAYNGLVPMSPKTTPSAPSVRAAIPVLVRPLLDVARSCIG